MKLFVANLPYSVDSDELKNIFAEYGEVVSAQVITDRDTGRSRGFGFVTMNDSDATKAMELLDGAEIDGRPIVVKKAEEKPARAR